MQKHVCPLCKEEDCFDISLTSTNRIHFNCHSFNISFDVSSSIIGESNEKTKKQIFNLIFEYLIKKPTCGDKNWYFFHEPTYQIKDSDEENYVNVAEFPYPHTFGAKVDRVLLNLQRVFPEYSTHFPEGVNLARAIFSDTETEDVAYGFLQVLADLGYLIRTHTALYRISAEGWKRIEKLTRGEFSMQQGFIAMSFSPEAQSIGDAFQKAIAESGYTPMRIDFKEHNNQIVPEILYEIDKSKFLVMDATYRNLGAYYEAGYALGKGKEVIACCRKEEFDNGEKPHFDILQKSLIIWETEDELVERLIRRIRATVK